MMGSVWQSFLFVMAQQAPAKHWVFTWNNPTVTDDVVTHMLGQLGVTYAVYQREVGESGTPHIQGYFELKNAKRMTGIKKVFTNQYLEKRQGPREKARAYCMKDESRVPGTMPVEVGTWEEVAQGKRTDLAGAIDAIRAGHSLKRVREDHPDTWVRYSRGLKDLAMMDMTERLEPPEVHLLYGPPGCGKTRTAMAVPDGQEPWVNGTGDSSWFDGYEGQDYAILDDFDGKFTKTTLRDALRLLDRYAIRWFVCHVG